MSKRKVVEFLIGGKSPFGKWFAQLDAHAAAKVTAALYRIEQGNLSNAKSVGKGVSEYRLDFGHGYRIYFGEEGEELVVLLGGGVKKRQDQDIKMAHILWAEYKREKKRLK